MTCGDTMWKSFNWVIISSEKELEVATRRFNQYNQSILNISIYTKNGSPKFLIWKSSSNVWFDPMTRPLRYCKLLQLDLGGNGWNFCDSRYAKRIWMICKKLDNPTLVSCIIPRSLWQLNPQKTSPTRHLDTLWQLECPYMIGVLD